MAVPTKPTLLFVLLGLLTGAFVLIWARQVLGLRERPGDDPSQQTGRPSPVHLVLGFVVNFLDTLGLGAMAPTTSVFKLSRMVPDRLIPGTLNVGLTLPTIAQGFIYIGIMDVDVSTLASMVVSATAGAWLGSGHVAGWSRHRIQIGMGVALLGAAVLLAAQLTGLLPRGAEALGLSGGRLLIALAGNFVLGALTTIGVGTYAPTLILLGTLGLSPRAIFPIMMGSGAFLLPVGSVRFIRRASYAIRPALGLTLAGVPAVFLAAFTVRSMSLDVLRWLVLIVVVYTSAAMLRSARSQPASGTAAPAPIGPTNENGAPR